MPLNVIIVYLLKRSSAAAFFQSQKSSKSHFARMKSVERREKALLCVSYLLAGRQFDELHLVEDVHPFLLSEARP
jgi:hypothetical protein